TGLPATLVFDYPSPGALAGFLLTELAGERAGVVPVAGPGREVSGDPVVIVGMACRYPGGVADPEGLWVEGGWDLEVRGGQGRGRSAVCEGGFLYDAADFDAGFFGVSPREAVA